MRILPLLLVPALFACSSIERSSLRARDLAWLAGSWRGTDERGADVHVVFTEPRDGALQGELRATRAGEVIVQSSMRIVSGTGGVVLLGTIEGNPPRSYALVETASRFVRFRASRAEYPAEVSLSRSGDSLTMKIRGASGLNTVREVVQELRLAR